MSALLQPGLAAQMLNAAEERPWLWVVYVLTVALPVVLIVVFCCTGKVTNTRAHQAKVTVPRGKVQTFVSVLTCSVCPLSTDVVRISSGSVESHQLTGRD